jgi:hypothetical protein
VDLSDTKMKGGIAALVISEAGAGGLTCICIGRTNDTDAVVSNATGQVCGEHLRAQPIKHCHPNHFRLCCSITSIREGDPKHYDRM